jgi:hypothetical protein
MLGLYRGAGRRWGMYGISFHQLVVGEKGGKLRNTKLRLFLPELGWLLSSTNADGFPTGSMGI